MKSAHDFTPQGSFWIQSLSHRYTEHIQGIRPILSPGQTQLKTFFGRLESYFLLHFTGGKYMNTLAKQNSRNLKEFSSLQRHIFTSGYSFKGRRAAQNKPQYPAGSGLDES